jgi:hypothetical protein
MLKYFLENICIYVSTFYVLTQSFVKNGYFSWPQRKRQKPCRKYFSTNFYHFYVYHIKIRFLKRLRGHVYHGDVHKKIIWNFLAFKYIKNVFQMKGAYAPKSKNSHVPSKLFYK